jgi:hypothetical protein
MQYPVGKPDDPKSKYRSELRASGITYSRAYPTAAEMAFKLVHQHERMLREGARGEQPRLRRSRIKGVSLLRFPPGIDWYRDFFTCLNYSGLDIGDCDYRAAPVIVRQPQSRGPHPGSTPVLQALDIIVEIEVESGVT